MSLRNVNCLTCVVIVYGRKKKASIIRLSNHMDSSAICAVICNRYIPPWGGI